MYAVIDLGSNSFHLLIAETHQQHLRVVGRCSEKIQLAEDLDKTGELSPQAITRGLDCLRQFQTILSQHPIQRLKVVGTEAMRRATNAPLFIRQAKTLGFDIDVISGEEEARWIFNGICGPLPDSTNRRLTIDIGGASTEIALGSDNGIDFSASVTVGCVSWRDQFFTPHLDYTNNKQAAADAALAKFAPVLDQLKTMHWDEVYASSGSAKMLSSIGYTNNWSDGNITTACVENIENYLGSVQSLEDINISGLKQQRLDLLAPGLVVMSTLMRFLAIEEIFYSPTALREGILAEMIQRRVDYQLQRERFN